MNNDTNPNGGPSISVAVSGGGHRAGAWALGVLQALVDADLGSQISSVTSVSGASITNAVIADRVDLNTVTRTSLDQATSDLCDVIASEGLFLPGSHTKRYTRWLLVTGSLLVVSFAALTAAVFGAGRDYDDRLWLLAGLPMLIAAIGVAAKSKGITARAKWLLGTALTIAIGAYVGSNFVAGSNGAKTAVVIAGATAATGAVVCIVVMQLAGRGRVAVSALDKAFFNQRKLSETGGPGSLPTVNHILSTADLESGDALYLAPRFVASYRRGLTTPDGISLAEATQASAALPLAFPPSKLHLDHNFNRPWTNNGPPPDTRKLWLSDGGAYDNMGEQWDLRRDRRLAEWGDLTPPGIGPTPALLIVANASAPWEWEPWTARTAIGREIQSLRRNQAMQYDQTTATRRAQLFTKFNTALREGQGLRGVILMIDRTPFQVCDAHTKDQDLNLRSRALEAKQALAQVAGCVAADCGHNQSATCPARDAWDKTAKHNSKIATTLGPIGIGPTASILAHARTVTTVYLYVLHGLTDLSQIEPPPALPQHR